MRLFAELRAWWRDEPPDHRVALALIIVVGVAIRLLTLRQPMRYDESVTYMEFVRLSLWQAMTSYQYPNNHLLHTLLVKATVALFGNSPVALRMPAFVSGILAIPLSYAAVRALYGARVALVATAVVASSGVLVLFATNARGYSMMLVAFLVLVIVASQLIRAPSLGLWAAFAVTAAVGMWTVPVMLYPLGTVALWLGLTFVVDSRRRDLAWLAGALTVGAALTLFAYAPILSRTGIAALVGNKFVAASPWPEFLSDMFLAGWTTLRSWTLGIPPLVSVGLFAIVVFGLVRHARHSTFRVGLPLAAFVWSSWLLVVTHRAPHPRMWLWCVPLLGALLGIGLIELIDSSKRLAVFAGKLPAVSVALAVVVAMSLVASNAVLSVRDTGTFPEAEQTARELSRILRPGDRVVAGIPTNGPLAYHFHRLGVDPAVVRIPEEDAERLIVVVNRAEDESEDDVSAFVADTARLAASIVIDRPMTRVYVFARKHAAK